MQKDIDYKAVLADLEVKYARLSDQRRALDAKEQALKSTIAGVKRLVDLESKEETQSAKPEPYIPSNAYTEMGVVEAAYRYLFAMGAPQTNRNLTDALLAHGFQTESKSPPETVRISLKQRGGPIGIYFRDGKWHLWEWEQSEIDYDEPEHEVIVRTGELSSDLQVIADKYKKPA